MVRSVVLLLVLGAGCEAPDCTPASPTSWPEIEQVDPILPVFPTRDGGVVLRRFSSSFESADDFTGFWVEPSPHRETTWQEYSSAQVASGTFAHRAWLSGRNAVVSGVNMNHRGYPTVQLHRRDGPFGGRVRIEFSVFLDVELRACREQDWFSFMTLSSYADDQWYQVQLLNVDSQGIAHLMHVPSYGEAVRDIFQTHSVKVPQRQWVTFTVLVDYGSANAWNSPYLAAWQDGVLVSAARFNPRVDPAKVPRSKWPACLAGWDGKDVAEAERLCQLDYRGALAQAHFGLYAPPLLRAGQVFNDDLEILELSP
jgi:hypothetical protein